MKNKIKNTWKQLELFTTKVKVTYWAHPYDKKGNLITNRMDKWEEYLEPTSWTLNYIKEDKNYKNVKIYT